MSKVVGVTIGIGDECRRMAACATQRFEAMTGLSTVILGQEHLAQTGCSSPLDLKFFLFDFVQADTIVYFDADTRIMRPWNLEPLVDRPEFMACRTFWFDKRVERLGQLYGFGARAISGGFFICNRKAHADVLRLARAIQPLDDHYPGLSNPDEIAINSALHILRRKIHFLDRRFNWLQYGRGNLANRAGVVVAHACATELKKPYESSEGLSPSRTPVDYDTPWPDDRVFIYDRVGHDIRPLILRPDGTILGGGDAERYWFLDQEKHELVLGSAFDETCRLTWNEDGTWQGRWTFYEQMPILLQPHRAQAILDLLDAGGRCRQQPLCGVEVGVFRGETAAILFDQLPQLHLWMIDPWRIVGADEHYWTALAGGNPMTQSICDAACASAIEATEFAAHRRTVIACSSFEAAPAVPDGLDFVFLDGDHTAEGVTGDLRRWWPKVAEHGFLAGHDYGNPDFADVKVAVDAFAVEIGSEIDLGSDFTWRLRRPGESRPICRPGIKKFWSFPHAIRSSEVVAVNSSNYSTELSTCRNAFHRLCEEMGSDKSAHGYDLPYTLFFEGRRAEPLRILEIGVLNGASLRVWEHYFPRATIIGLDRDPRCAAFASPRSHVLIGEQDDPEFLDRVIAEFGSEFDLIVDDGGHRMGPQQMSLRLLWPHVRPGGWYVVEDLESSFAACERLATASTTAIILLEEAERLCAAPLGDIRRGLCFFANACFLPKPNIRVAGPHTGGPDHA